MIPFVIPKASTESLELDLASAQRGKVEGKQAVFNSILAAYLGELAGEVDPHFGLEEASKLAVEKDKLKGNNVSIEQLPVALLNMRLSVQVEVIGEQETETAIAISQVTQEQLWIPEAEAVPEMEIPDSDHFRVLEAPGTIESLDFPKTPTTDIAVPLMASKPEEVPLTLDTQLEIPQRSVVESVSLTRSQPQQLLAEGFEVVSGQDVITVSEQFPTVLRTVARQFRGEDAQTLPKESESELVVVPKEALTAELELAKLVSAEKVQTETPTAPTAHEPHDVQEPRVQDFPASRYEQPVLTTASFEEESSNTVQTNEVTGDLVTDNVLEANHSEVSEVFGQKEKPRRQEDVLGDRALHAGDILARPVQAEFSDTVADLPSKPTLDLQAREPVLPKLTEHIKTLVHEERTEVRIQLKPEHLGELKIKLSLERGIMMAEFVVENEAVREVIASQLPQLHTALQEQGANVAEMMVNVGFGQGKRDDETPTRHRQASLPNRGQFQTGAVSQNKSSYLSRSPWNQVDLKA